MRRRIVAVLSGAGGPTLLALLFAGMSVVPVAASLMPSLLNLRFTFFPVAYRSTWPDWESWRTVDLPQALQLATVAVVASAILGGTLGGLAARRKRELGFLVAIGTAWPVGIASLSFAGAVLDIPFQYGGTNVMLRPEPDPMITTLEPASGAVTYLVYSIGSFIAGGFLGLWFFALAWETAAAVRNRAAPVLGSVLLILGYACIHWATVVGNVVAFLCLALGVAAWSAILSWAAAQAAEPLKPEQSFPPPDPETEAGGPPPGSRRRHAEARRDGRQRGSPGAPGSPH